MEFMDVIETRRSIRSYADKEVPDESLGRILRTAMMAPSAGNQKPWHFIITRDREKLRAVSGFHPYAAMLPKASVSILVCGDPEGKAWPDFWPQDCSAAVQNMLLAAREMGLGTVWVGVYPLEERMRGMRRLFGIPDNIHPFAIVPVGWPDKGFISVDRYDPGRIHPETWQSV